MSFVPETYHSGTIPVATDTRRTLLEKILLSTNAGGGGGGGGGGNAGTGSPEGSVTASPGATYLDTSTGNFWAKKIGAGNTGWLELIAS